MASQQTYRAVGVFTDGEFAQRVVQRLKEAGYTAMVATDQEARNLSSYGFNQDEVGLYSARFNEGNSLVLVDAGNQGDEILQYLLQAGAENIDLSKGGAAAGGQQRDARYYQSLQSSNRRYGPVDETTGQARTAEEATMILRSESLIPVKQSVQAGEVQIRKTVEERQQQVPVTLAHEEVTIERRPITDQSQLQGADFAEQTISVPIYEEQAQLQRQVTGEEVVVHKQAVQEQQTISGTTRHEHVEVDQTGNVQVQGDVQTTQTTYNDTDTNRNDRGNR